MTILSLGRYGDIISQLPVAYASNLSGGRDTFIVSHEFADLFDGVGYCDKRTYSGNRVDLPHAISICQGLPDLRVAQVDRNPDQSRHERNYALEGYRLGRFRHLWRKAPLIFDRRDPVREQLLLDKTIKSNSFILVNCNGESSPFPHSKQLIDRLQSRFPSHQIVDLSQVRAEKIFDLLGLMDRAECLITTDTSTLWLANASKRPTVSLINDGWRGSPPPTTGVASFRYNDFHRDQVCDEVEKTLLPEGRVVGIVHQHGNERRHKIAMKSYSMFDELLTTKSLTRTAIDLGDTRPLRMLKDMLGHALKFTQGRDIIIWTNDDVQLLDLSPVVDHVRRFGAVSIRRDPSHMGREMLAFRWDWLADRFYNFPDGVMAGPWFDLATAAWIRNHFGYKSDFQNIAKDFYPCEIPNNGIFHHPDDHESSWTPYMTYPASLWNERLWKMEINKQ